MGSTTAAPAPAASALPPLRTAISRPLDPFERLRELLRERGVRSSPRAGHVLARQGEAQGRLFLLEAGSVELSCVVESGRECVLDLVLPGECLGGFGLEAPFSAIAREGCQVVGCGSAEIHAALGREPGLAAVLVEIANGRALRLAERLRDTLVLDSTERVIAELCDLADRRSTSTPEGRRVDLFITQEDLARMTGYTRETVNRTLNRLLAQRRLIRRGRRYVIPYRVGR